MRNGFLRISAALLLACTAIQADQMAASQTPPGGLAPEQTPQFVTIGFDDNGYSGATGSGGDGGMTWATNYFKNLVNPDGTPVRANFYFTTYYISTHSSESPVYVKKSWRKALEDGHEYGNHTQSHPDGAAFSASQWDSEIATCETWLTKPYDANESVNAPNDTKGIGALKSNMYGFRAPYLHYTDALFTTLRARGYQYDCSIEEGWQPTHNGTNYFWPYTLDQGSPGHTYLYTAGTKNFAVGNHPGLWEMPVHPVIVPTDAACASYGIGYSLRNKVKQAISWFDLSSGKLTALDYTLFVEAKMTKAEALATLKYTLDLRLSGNRAPFLFGAHTDEYSPKYTYAPNATAKERQETIEEFVAYAISKSEVRFTTMNNIISWMKNPTPLSGNVVVKRTIDASVVPHEVTSGTGCSYPAWSATATYAAANTIVSYNGRSWKNKWYANPGEKPGVNDVWADMGECGGTTATYYYGTISPAGAVKVDDGANASFAFTAEPGYEVKSIIVDGVTTAKASSYTFTNVTANHTIAVDFGPVSTSPTYYTITSSAGAGGSVTPLGAVTVQENTAKTFTFTPNAGYRVDTVLVNGVGAGEPTSYTFNSVTSNQTIAVEFELIPVVDSFTVTASVSGNGTITPAGAKKVLKGSSIAYTIAANSGNKIDSVKVNGTNVGAVSSYTVSNVTANGTITAYFSPVVVVDSFTVTASVSGNGTITPAGAKKVLKGSSIAYAIAANSGNKIDSVKVNGTNVGAVSSFTVSNVTANGTITAYFSATSTGGICTGVADWDVNQSWTTYKVGDRKLNANKVWEVTNVAYAIYEPSGSFGAYGWKLIGSCQ